jgi:hypothetical protein
MRKKTGITGTGSYQNDVTEGINRASVVRIRRNTLASDAWRKAKEEDPSLEFRMSFFEFKKGYLKKFRNPLRGPRK